MTAGLSVEVRRHTAVGREELRRQLLALVLACVLVWYTLVGPVGPATPRRFEPEDDDGEVRGLKPSHVNADSRPVEDLDWPEYIYP